MKKHEIILGCITAVCTVIALIALALPVYVPKPNMGSDDPFTLANLAFGYEKEGVRFFDSYFILIIPVIAEIIGCALAALTFIPKMKGKQALRITSFILYVAAMACYFAGNGSYSASGGNYSYIADILKEFYDKSYAAIMAGVCAVIAGAAQFAEYEITRRADKKEKSAK